MTASEITRKGCTKRAKALPDGSREGYAVILEYGLTRAQHDAGLFARRGGLRLEAVRHAADDTGAVQYLHGGQGVGGDAALIREGVTVVCSSCTPACCA